MHSGTLFNPSTCVTAGDRRCPPMLIPAPADAQYNCCTARFLAMRRDPVNGLRAHAYSQMGASKSKASSETVAALMTRTASRSFTTGQRSSRSFIVTSFTIAKEDDSAPTTSGRTLTASSLSSPPPNAAGQLTSQTAQLPLTRALSSDSRPLRSESSRSKGLPRKPQEDESHAPAGLLEESSGCMKHQFSPDRKPARSCFSKRALAAANSSSVEVSGRGGVVCG